MTYNVFGGTLNLAQSINQSKLGQTDLFFVCLIRVYQGGLCLQNYMSLSVAVIICVTLVHIDAQLS